MRANRIYCWALLVVFNIGILLPLIFVENRDRSLLENRQLAQRPSLSRAFSEGFSFLDSVSLYFDDQYGFRESAAIAGNGLRSRLGFRVSGLVVEGKEGWLYFAGGANDRPLDDFMGLNLLSERELKQWADALSERSSWLAARGVEYVFLIAPNKAEIYPEYLPDEYARRSGLSRAEQLVGYLRQNTDVQVLYVRDELLAAKEKGALYPSFGKKGTHWNSFGAGIGFNPLGNWLAEVLETSPFEPYADSDFQQVRAGIDNDLERLLFGDADGIGETPGLFRAIKGTNGAELDRLLGRGEGAHRLETFQIGDSERRMLVFGDSFFLGLAPFLVEFCGELEFKYGQPTTQELKQAMVGSLPAVVIEQRVERNLWRVPQ